MLKFHALIVASCFAVTIGTADAAQKKKDVRSGMTEKQKAELRAKAREWCKKQIVGKSGGRVVRVEILSNGSARCYYGG